MSGKEGEEFKIIGILNLDEYKYKNMIWFELAYIFLIINKRSVK